MPDSGRDYYAPFRGAGLGRRRGLGEACDAAQRNYRTYVARDAVAEIDPAKHEHGLSTLAYAFCWIATSDEVISGWGAGVESVERAPSA